MRTDSGRVNRGSPAAARDGFRVDVDALLTPDVFCAPAPGWAEGLDYLTRSDLEALDLPPAVVRQLLRDTQLTGHRGEPVVEAARLADLLAMLTRDGERGRP
jgi:hypothetical protein